MKILIISGFLGAGKTTFIKELVKRTGKNFVILENEYGTADVDQQVLKDQSQMNVWDLSEGCVCCTKSADLNASVMTIESTIEPEFLIIEPSGVGSLGNVIRNLQRIEYERIKLLRPITIVDALCMEQYYNEFADIYGDQIRSSSLVAISKPERPSSYEYDAVKKIIEETGSRAELLDRHYTLMPDTWWNSLLMTAYDGKVMQSDADMESGLETYSVSHANVSSPAELLCILDQALNGRFGEIVRAKGIIPAGGEMVRFDIAGGRITITGFDTEDGTEAKAECVWIGRGLDRLAIKKYLHATFTQIREKKMHK